MGNYLTTINTPAYNMDITKSEQYSLKYGYGINIEQALTQDIGLFTRLGWNDGHTESWAVTEIDQTVSGGINLKGNIWNRLNDHAGIGFAVNGLSKDHLAYLQAGGYDFNIGDGQIRLCSRRNFRTILLLFFIKRL